MSFATSLSPPTMAPTCPTPRGCGVQYHPEYTLAELASLIERRAKPLAAEGFFARPEDAGAYAADLRALDADPSRTDLAWRHGLDAETLDPTLRRRELRNFIDHQVLGAP